MNMDMVEKIASNVDKFGFFRTTARRPQERHTEPAYLFSIVSSINVPAKKAVAPIPASTKKRTSYETYASRSAPMIGATIGAMITMDMTSAITFSRFRPYFSLNGPQNNNPTA